MTRMSNKKKTEWSLYLNERNRITYNKLCKQCIKDCKQSFRCLVIQCPMFKRKEKSKNGCRGMDRSRKTGVVK